ncbi:MAG: HIT family protein [Patescibacteria group bacterium]
MSKLPKAPKESMIYEDKRVYVCLAMYPLTKGHTIVVWEKPVRDIHDLSCKQYEHLMNIVDITRDALLKTLKVKKVYLLYMDEVKHVHWHLVPRFNEKGVNALLHIPKRAKDFSLALKLRNKFSEVLKKHKKDF